MVKPSLNPAQSLPQTQAFPLYDSVKFWYFENMAELLESYMNYLKEGTITQHELIRFRGGCIMLFIALKEKIVRQSTLLTKEENELVTAVIYISSDPLKTISQEGKDNSERFKFWTKVLSLIIKILDVMGITKIDPPKMDTYQEAMLKSYDV